MSSSTVSPRSFAVTASWSSLGLALGGASLFFVFLLADQILAFEKTRQGILTGFLPRTFLFVLWAGEAMAVLVGVASFLLIRRGDVAAKAVAGIVARSLCGIAAGLFGTLFLWLIVGHIVIGF